MIGARQLAQHERVKPIGLPARDPEAVPRGGDLVRMHRQHPQARVEQPLDQQPVRPLDRDQPDIQPHQHATQPAQVFLVMRERSSEQLLAILVGHEHVVRLRRPIDPGIPLRHLHPPVIGTPSQSPDPEVPLRMLIDKALTSSGLRPVAARGTSPPPGRAGLWQALHTRASNRGPLPAAVEATKACPMSAQERWAATAAEAIAERVVLSAVGVAERMRCRPAARMGDAGLDDVTVSQ